ncbi:ATP-binding protein [Streptomyces sp. M10(2022)]
MEADKEQRTLSVRDNGIGMSHDEVVQLIGTIANSGTAKFLQELKEAKDSTESQELIGQFGVGFYASFMVADEVTLLTRRAGESQGTRWQSNGEGRIPSNRSTMPAGHLGHSAAQARGRRGQALRLHLVVEAPGNHQALLGLHYLAHSHDRGGLG